MKHKNHVELSVEDHAEEHRKLFVEHGKQEDFIEWHRLKGKASMIASKKGGHHSDEHKKKISESMSGKVRTAEHAKNNRDSRIHNKDFIESN